jgi:S-adenosylmethionine hydrolase
MPIVGEFILPFAALMLALLACAIPYYNRRPIIVVQTDYGTESPYMGALLGAIYRVDPRARIHMITADVAPYEPIHAAWTLRLASADFPSGTIFVCVTNPGGTTSQASIIQTLNGHIYVGHDNGLFDFVVQDYGFKRAYSISNPKLSRPRYQSLYGISLFGPTAGHLSMGLRLKKIGPRLSRYEPKLPRIRKEVTDYAIAATVMDVDRFGNATLNATEVDLGRIGLKIADRVKVTLNRGAKVFEFRETYGHVSIGDPVAIIFLGYVQLAIRERSLAECLAQERGEALKRGEVVQIAKASR